MGPVSHPRRRVRPHDQAVSLRRPVAVRSGRQGLAGPRPPGRVTGVLHALDPGSLRRPVGPDRGIDGYRHPGILAKEMATLDLISEGRVEFGIGAGWMKSDYEEYGLSYDSPGERISRMEEGLAIIKQLWTEGSATFDGTYYRYTGANGNPRPVQQPHPPVLIGGGGKRML